VADLVVATRTVLVAHDHQTPRHPARRRAVLAVERRSVRLARQRLSPPRQIGSTTHEAEASGQGDDQI